MTFPGAGDDVGVETTDALRGRAERDRVRREREVVGERASSAGAEALPVDRRVVERAGDRGGEILPELVVETARVRGHDLVGDGHEERDLLAGHRLHADAGLRGGLHAASPTQSATGTSIGTGIAVCADTDSGTRRARDITADCSTAFAKIGPVMVGGSSCARRVGQEWWGLP
jgi:hypothetical protein